MPRGKQGGSMDIVIPGAANLGLFVVAAVVLLVTPGPAVLYIVTRAIEQGRLAGLVSILGVHAATLVHVAAAAAGLSAISPRRRSPLASSTMRWRPARQAAGSSAAAATSRSSVTSAACCSSASG